MSILRHSPAEDLPEDKIITPTITDSVPRIFCAVHTSPKKSTARPDEKIGAELTIGVERATPIRSMPM